MKIRPTVGLSFDDVLLVPKYSGIRSRSAVDTSTDLVKGIRLHIPILSANMDTITEARMAIAIAQQGGIGILHRFMSIADQAEQVERVKRAESMVVEKPITIRLQSTVAEARQKMAESEVGGLLVVDGENHLLGLITNRDVLLAQDAEEPILTVMTPKERLITAGPDEPLDSARHTLYQHRLEKLPLVDDEGRVAGLITVQDIIKIQQHPDATKDNRGRLRVGVAIGVRSDDMQRAEACLKAGADVLLVDIAHGHSSHTMRMVERLKKRWPEIPVIAGNVAEAQGVRDLVSAGADAVKVGVGAGSICITRVVTGFGVPQLTAVAECAEAGQTLGIPIIADGGVRTSGDLTKALAAGASTCHARQPAGRHGRSPRRPRGAGWPPIQGGARHGLADCQRGTPPSGCGCRDSRGRLERDRPRRRGGICALPRRGGGCAASTGRWSALRHELRRS